jgi:hypothetical protein
MPRANTLARSLLAPEKPPTLTSELAHDRFHPLPHVVSTRAGDTTVLMNRQSGIYYTLNEVGGRIWELLGDGGTISALIERLLEEYDVPRQQLETDVRATVQEFLADRLIASGPMPVTDQNAGRPMQPALQVFAGSGELRVPSVLRCGVMLLIVKVMLKTRRFDRTVDWARRQVERVPTVGMVDVDALKRVEYAVAMAGALYPGRALCLEQSLVLYNILRRQGVAVTLRLGAQPFPFAAHAWVEYEGVVINDVPEHVRQFAPLQDLSA